MSRTIIFAVWLACMMSSPAFGNENATISAIGTSEEKEAFGICRDSNHVFGRWVYNERFTDKDKSFFCCGWDNNDFTSNWELCGVGSMAGWAKQFNGRERLAQAGGHACVCDSAGGWPNRLVMHPREKYQWTPTYCNLLPWNATQFCELLGDRVVLLRGDSTSIQVAVTLMNMISAKGGKCQSQIYSSSANLLGYKDKDQYLLHEAVAASNASIVVISAGAHFHDTASYERAWDALIPQIVATRQQFPHVKLTWRTVVPGHVDCKNNTAPIHNYFPPKKEKDYYQWGIQPIFDNYSRRRSKENNITMIEMSPLYLRPDAHSDCLHMCLPGPLDLFPVLLLGMLYTGEL